MPAAAVLAWCLVPPGASAEGRLTPFVGVVAGVSTLSADARSEITPDAARVSLYKPENGPALDVFAGVHAGRFFAVQGNYIANGNDLTLVSSRVGPEGGGFSEQGRSSAQHAVIVDLLLYFRALDNRIRPYLSTGVGLVRFASGRATRTISSNAPPADDEIEATRVGLRVAVGIDLAVRGGWSVRYSFSETISGNPVSARLTPPGQRNLANFQNLFGVVRRF